MEKAQASVREDTCNDRVARAAASGTTGRDRSLSQEWDESQPQDDARSYSSQKSDPGYHSTGALSEVALQANATFNELCHHSLSSLRSVGSVGSQGSGDRYHAGYRPYQGISGAAHIVNGETRFPTYAIEAPKSDAATVCSGSVVEDIEVESIISGDLNVPPTASSNISSAHPSPPSSVKMAFCGGLRRPGSGGNRVVEFAEEPLATVLPQRATASHAAFSNPPRQHESDMAMHNSMGPPLSRSLLLQHPQADPSSRAGSIKSVDSNAGSDVVAHVDPDECEGSLVGSITDAHSIHSQEEATNQPNLPDPTVAAAAAAPAVGYAPGDAAQLPHPWLRSESTPSGRTSPGGTIYKGRGVRRYQGRYMHLPLKRFHQNGVNFSSFGEVANDNIEYPNSEAGFGKNGESHFDADRPCHGNINGESLSAKRSYVNKDPRRRSPCREYRGEFSERNGFRNGARKEYRSRSRSRSPAKKKHGNSARFMNDRYNDQYRSRDRRNGFPGGRRNNRNQRF